MAATMRQAGQEAARKAAAAKLKALAKGGMPSKNLSAMRAKPVAPGSVNTTSIDNTDDAASAEGSSAASKTKTDPNAEETSKVPRDDVFEGLGTKDPDEEAVVPDSKDTITVEEFIKSSAQDEKLTEDPDQAAAVAGSKEKIEGKDNVASETEESKANDPDAEAVVPDTKGKVDVEGKGGSKLDSASKSSDDDNGNGAGAKGRNTIKNTTDATAPSDDTEALPGARTQDQAPAKADEAGASVAD